MSFVVSPQAGTSPLRPRMALNLWLFYVFSSRARARWCQCVTRGWTRWCRHRWAERGPRCILFLVLGVRYAKPVRFPGVKRLRIHGRAPRSAQTPRGTPSGCPRLVTPRGTGHGRLHSSRVSDSLFPVVLSPFNSRFERIQGEGAQEPQVLPGSVPRATCTPGCWRVPWDPAGPLVPSGGGSAPGRLSVGRACPVSEK